MKRFLVIPVIALCLWLYLRETHILGTTDTLTASEIISIANAVRQTHGLPPLKPQDQLTGAAEAKAAAMMAANAWSHNTPTSTPWDFINDQGYIYLIAGENLAKGFVKPEDVVQSWLDSPSHRANLLSPEYTHTGVAVMVGEYQNVTQNTLVVQYLAKPLDLTAAAETVEPQFFPDLAMTEVVIRISPLLMMVIFLLGSLSLAAVWLIVKIRQPLEKSPPTIKHWKRR